MLLTTSQSRQRRASDGSAAARHSHAPVLLRLAALLLAVALAGERLLGAALVARLQVEGVLLDVLDDVFLLHFSLETSQRALDRLTFLNFTSAISYSPPSFGQCRPAGGNPGAEYVG